MLSSAIKTESEGITGEIPYGSSFSTSTLASQLDAISQRSPNRLANQIILSELIDFSNLKQMPIGTIRINASRGARLPLAMTITAAQDELRNLILEIDKHLNNCDSKPKHGKIFLVLINSISHTLKTWKNTRTYLISWDEVLELRAELQSDVDEANRLLNVFGWEETIGKALDVKARTQLQDPEAPPHIKAPEIKTLAPQGCTSIFITTLCFMALSSSLGIYFTLHKEFGYSMGDSFTLAAYVMGMGTLVCGLSGAFHYPRCRCWQKPEEPIHVDATELR